MAMETDSTMKNMSNNQDNDDQKSMKSSTNNLSSMNSTTNSVDSSLNGIDIDIIKPARSGYMLFAKENRSKVIGCGAVSEQSRKISALWNALSDIEKEKYNKKVAEDKKNYELYLENNPEIKQLILNREKKRKESRNNNNSSFALGTIKKIILKDPDIKRISKESVLLITNSTELFIKDLIKNINLKYNQSKLISYQHFIDTLHSNQKYMFQRHVFKKNKNNHNNINQPPPKKKQRMNNDNNNNNNKITNFFHEQQQQI